MSIYCKSCARLPLSYRIQSLDLRFFIMPAGLAKRELTLLGQALVIYTRSLGEGHDNTVATRKQVREKKLAQLPSGMQTLQLRLRLPSQTEGSHCVEKSFVRLNGSPPHVRQTSPT